MSYLQTEFSRDQLKEVSGFFVLKIENILLLLCGICVILLTYASLTSFPESLPAHGPGLGVDTE